MKVVVLICLVGCLIFTNLAHADLNLIGQGTSAHGTYSLIYDSDLNITWYDYTNAGRNTWYDQMAWADALTVTFGSNAYDDWRLPETPQPDSSCQGQSDPGGGYPLQGAGYNCTGSEMGHLYYTELGNSAGGPLSNTGPFQNLQAVYYWSGTEYAPDKDLAWHFITSYGHQGYTSYKVYDGYAIAVRNGMAVMPEPICSILFIFGGALLIGRKYIRRKKAA